MCVACTRKWLWIVSCVLFILYTTVCPGSCTNDHLMLLENCGWKPAYWINSSKETIKTPGIDVSPNLVCMTIIMPARLSLSLKIVKFNLKGSGECSPTSERLSLEVRRDTGYKNITWCGQTFAEELNLPLEADVTLIYNSGAYGEGSGFEIQFSLVNSKGWNLPKLSASAEPKLLYSPNYPKDYPGSISTSVILTTDAGQYIHIKSREISIEPSSRCDYDYLSINNVLYCGDENIDVIVPLNSMELKFTSDNGLEKSGFVLEYSSLVHQNFSCANEEALNFTASEFKSLIVINQTLFKSNKRCSLFIDSGSDDKVLAVNVPLRQNYTISFDDNRVLDKRFPATAQYFQSPGRNLSISLDIGLFQTNNSWIMWNLTVQNIDRGFLPTRLLSQNSLFWINQDMIRSSREHHFDISRRLGFKVFGADLCCSLPVSEKVDLFNGPDKSFFELTRDCRGLPRSDMAIFSEGGPHVVTVVIRNTSNTEFWLYLGPADPSQAMLKTEFKDNSSFNSYSLIKSLKVKNLFCRWEIQGSMLPVTIQARNNFNVLSNNSFVVKQVLSLDDPRPKAEAEYDQDTPDDTLMYSFYPVVITVSIVDQDSQYQSPDFSFGYQQDIYLINQSSYNYSNLKALNQEQIVQTPYYPHFYPSNIYYSWTIKNTPTQEASVIVLTFPDLSSVLCSDTSVLNISTSINVAGDIFGQPSRICGKRSLTQYYDASSVKVEFTTNFIIKPGFQFFFYHEASSVQQYNCGSNITLQERVSSYLMYVQRASDQSQDCYFYLYPTSHDSSITLRIDLDFQYGNNLIVYSMKPSVISSTKYRWQEVLSLNQQNKQTGNFTFAQSTLAVKAHFDYMPANFKIRALLSRDSCLDVILEATTVDNYLASPRYPEPYPISTVCKWNIISKQGNIILETVDYILKGLSYSCANDYLLVYVGPIQDQNLLWRYCSPEQFNSSANEITVVFKPDQSFKTLGFRLKFYARPTSILTTSSSYPDDTSAPPSMILGSVIGCIIFAVLLFAAVILIIKKRRMANRLPRREPRVYMNRRESTIFIVNPVIINNMSPPPYPGLEPDSLLSNVPSIFASPPPYSERAQTEEDDSTYHNIDLPPPYTLSDQVSPENSQELVGNNQPESRGDNSNVGQWSQSPDVIYDVACPLPYEAEYAEITLHHPVSNEQANTDPPPAYNDVRADSRTVQTGRQISRSVPGRGNSLGPL
ncbi:unnamed protein product [Lymnaea stagnalis]|uniref:CUB domain-containing protein n=1 Tax=Lymnaea stagnalis TaxID=6523 RepID=A0AAV2HM78_LYMST